MTKIITILLAAFGWWEIHKAADERNWIRFFLGFILLILAIIRSI